MAMFKAFKPEAMNKIANAMGYSGDMNQFQQFIEQDPAKQARMNMFKEAAVQMAKGGYAKNYKDGGAVPPRRVDIKGQDHMLAYITPEEGELLKAHGGSGKPGPMGIPSFESDGPTVEATHYYAQDPRDPDNSIRVRIGSRQDTYDNRARTGYSEETHLAFKRNPLQSMGKSVPPISQQYGSYVETPTAQQAQADSDTQAAAAEQAAAEAQATADAQAAAQAQAAAEAQQAAAAQQQYSQQVAAQMQNNPGQPPSQSAPGQPYAFRPPGNLPAQTAQTGQQAYVQPYVPPIYQAPYLSGTQFTPVGQYVQDPNTGQPVAQAYNPLNQGYGAAAANFQQQIQGGYGTNTTNTDISETTLTQNKGGYIKPQKFAVGGTVTNPSGTQAATPVVTGPSTPKDGQPAIGQFSVEQMYTPGVPVGGTTIAAQTQQNAQQDIAGGTGTLTGSVAVPTATAAASQAQQITPSQTNTMQAVQAAPAVDAAMQATQAAQANPQDPRAQVTAAQQTASSVGNLQAAQGNASLINNPVQRQIQQGELITGAANAATASAFTAQVQAAQATPTQQATVQGQLDGLMQQFQGGATPSWAAGAMRAATAAMAARGLGASSLAGQAIVQAAMESALPIAQADAATQAQFEGQNLSNRQQRAMLAAQQRAQFMGQEFDQAFQSRVQNSARIGDIANMNFTAEQQVQLENARATNTMNLNNLSNSQAMVMAEAASLAQLDTQNLNNRQQSAVQNAQSFLQTDMANLSNQQQTELFKAQQRTQSMFTDQAAKNAAAQFNASSENQVDQFFQQLGSQVSQFNATQANAQAQYNAGQTNTVNRFNAELNNQRDQYNAQNQMVIAQSNAQWRRQIATADTAAVNRANELNANAVLDISKQAYDNLWSYYSDTMEWAWNSAENEAGRQKDITVATINAEKSAEAERLRGDYNASSSMGGFAMDIVKGVILGGF